MQYLQFKLSPSYSKFLTIVCLATIIACGPARHLKEDEKLLTKVKIKTDDHDFFTEDLKAISKQKPNRKLLGMFKIYLGVYNLFYEKDSSKIKDKLGEPPVVFDSALIEPSVMLMHQYLNNRGYYDNVVSAKIKEKRKRAEITYHVEKKKVYHIQNLEYLIDDDVIQSLVYQDTLKAHIKKQGKFDLSLIKKERIRLERMLRNKGYFNFNREFIKFEVDTFGITKSADLRLIINKIKNKLGDTDSLIEEAHPIFSIKKIIVNINDLQNNALNAEADSLIQDEILFVSNDQERIRKDVIARHIYFRPGDNFKLDNQEQTYSNLSSLGIFSFVGIQYDYDFSEGNKLIAYINLTPRKQRSFSIETEGTNNGGNLGVNGTVTLLNNNTFKGAERFNISINGGLEVQQILTNEQDEVVGDGFLPFNTIEFGPEISFEIPRFLLPISQKRFSPRGNPKTIINASFNFQQRPDYVRSVSKTALSYSWNESATKKHIINPIDLSYIKLDPTDDFLRVLESINNPFLRNSYTDNFILALKYSYILNSQFNQNDRNHFYFRINAESAGNGLSLLEDGIINNQNEDGSYNVGGIRYAQYIRSDFDFRFYQSIDVNQIVYRFYTGLGIPYGNSQAMPFEKSFFAGGANGIRAWRVRELGPGSIPDSSQSNIDQIGNMKLEANVELRFPITNIVEGAAFADLGNIWNVDQDDSREETNFELNRLWDGTAVGLGLGLRLNFTFFLLRFDFATPFKDPANTKPNLIHPEWRQSNLNLGIGYPF